MTTTSERAALFWDLAAPLLLTGAAEKSTMMGFPCLRSKGQFFASLARGTDHLIVKLPATRVEALVAAGQGLHFSPNGRTFREWVVIPEADATAWSALITEARAFVLRK